MSDPDLDISPEEAASWARYLYGGGLPHPPVLDGARRIQAQRISRVRRRERADYAPVDESEDLTIKHKHPPAGEDLADDVEGAQYADVYKSRSTYDRKPSPPRETRLVQHRHLVVEDIADGPERKPGEEITERYKSRSTYEVGEIGSVVAEKARRLKEKSVQTFEEGKPWKGFGEYATGVALSGGVSFIRGAASAVNPLEWVRSAQDLSYLVASKKAQSELAKTVAKDPLSFAVDIGAGIAGGYTAGRGLGQLYRGWKKGKLVEFYEEFPEEAFYAEDGIPDPAFPEQVSVQRSSFTGFEKKKVRIAYDTGGTEGLYYGMGPLDEGAEVSKISAIPDESLAVKWELDKGRMRISMDQGYPPIGGVDDLVKVTKTKKGLVYKLGDEYGLVQTGHDLVPTILPEGVGRLETIYRPIHQIQYESSHLPGVRGLPPYFDAALALSITPGIDILHGVGAASGLLSGVPDIDIPMGDSKIKLRTTQDTVEEQVNKQVNRLGSRQRQRGREREMFATDPLLNEKTVITPKVGKLPGFMPMPPIEETTLKQDDRTITGLTYKQTTRQMKDYMEEVAALPGLSIASYPGLKKPPGTPKIRIPRIPKKPVSSVKLPGLGAGFGETRRRALSPEELVTGRKPRTKKTKKKKKSTKKKKTKKKRKKK